MHFITSMKNRLSINTIIERINAFGPDMGGVLSFADLWNLLGLKSSDRVAKVVDRLMREKVLFKIQRNVYATKNPDLWILASRLKKGSYISMDSVLAKNALIGTIPTYTVSSVYAGAGRKTVETPFGSLRYFSIKKDLIFGISRLKNGVEVADSEKAYLDLLYFYMKGARYVIDPQRDVSLWKLDLKKLKKYLKAYKNPKFVSFVEGLIREIA